jgi:uncharacterized membrane protein YhaH (DUF805 family)
MIYKFIDNNGSEISVNSLSSLQALVDSETVKENTKVKAGLRGKWTTASNIEELNFNQEVVEDLVKTMAPEGDIKSFITAEEKIEEIINEEKQEEAISQPWQSNKTDNKSGTIEKESNTNRQELELSNDPIKEKSEYEIENERIALEEKNNKIYDNENVIGINFTDSIKVCFKKYFVIEGRASRSEYWYWFLFVFILGLFVDYLDALISGVPWLEYENPYGPLAIILTVITFLPGLAVGVRRLHDVNKSGWWLLISFTVIGLIPLIIWAISKGNSGKNQFGEYPLKLKKGN